MDKKESRKADRREMEWTTAYLEASPNPLHREILFILTNGFKTGVPIKEEKKDAN